jgi:hypothetical protein
VNRLPESRLGRFVSSKWLRAARAAVWRWWKNLALASFVALLAFQTFHLSRLFVFDGDVLILALAVAQERSPKSAQKDAEGASPSTESATLCFVPSGTTEESLASTVAPYLSVAAFSELSAWVHRWWGDGDGVWWLARQTGDHPLHLIRMDDRLRPMLKAPLCLPETRVKYVNVGKDERGALFQVLDCRSIPSACAASVAVNSKVFKE